MDFKIPDTPEEMFGKMKKNVPRLPWWSSIFPLLILAFFISSTCVYTVEQDEEGVVRRFGKYVRTTAPGLQWKLPFMIESVDKVQVRRVKKEEFGYRTLKAGINTKYSPRSYDEESLMLTGDLNVLDVSWSVQFLIKDPVAYLFNIKNSEETVRDISESVMRQVIGDFSVSEAVTTKKEEINQKAKDKMQEILDLYKSGILISKIELQDILPPAKVKSSFNEVNEAEQEKEKVINESWESYNKVIPRAKGEAERTIREAEGYALSRVKKAEGDANRFLQMLKEYTNAKDVTQKRLYLETMAEVLPKTGKIYVFEPKANNVLPLLKLNEGEK